jgi:hypothetical protein
LQADTTFFPATFVEEAVCSPSYVFGAFVKIKVSIAVWIHSLFLYSAPLVFISAFLTVTCCFYCYGFVVSALLFVLGIGWLFTVFSVHFSISGINVTGGLMGILLLLVV